MLLTVQINCISFISETITKVIDAKNSEANISSSFYVIYETCVISAYYTFSININHVI